MVRFFDLLCLLCTMLLHMGRRRWIENLVLVCAVLLEFSNTTGKIMDMVVTAIRRKFAESRVETQKVVLVQTTGTLTAEDMLSELLRVLRTNELLVIRGSDVDQSANGR